MKLWVLVGIDLVFLNIVEIGGGCFFFEFFVYFGVWFCFGEFFNVVVFLSIFFSFCMI